MFKRTELSSEVKEKLEGDFIKLSNGFTYYELKGDKSAKTIVLVHGNAAPSCSWDYNINALVNSGFRVLRYDIFGHGFSDRPNLYKYDRELYDIQLVELLEKLDINEAIYMAGTSQGGSISAHFAAKHPGRVEKLALLAPLFDGFEGSKKAALLAIPVVGEIIMFITGKKNIINPLSVLYSDEKADILSGKLKMQSAFKGKRRAVLANLRGNALGDASEFYENVKEQEIPMLLTWGIHDKSISRESMQRLRDIVPALEYHELENASHLAHYELPEKVNPVLIDFFRK